MTRRDRVGLAFLVPAIAAFIVADLPSLKNGPWNAVLTFAGIILVVLGFLRMRRMSEP
ncbi:MAG TPA: hypothetical protein VGA22_09225 [Gemmatimonadales bacterium]|jgi:hypothetical protein